MPRTPRLTVPSRRNPAADTDLWDDQRMIDLLLSIDRMSQSITEAAAQLRGLSPNDVITVETVKLDGDGLKLLEASVPFSAAMVTNEGWGTVTLTAVAPTGSTPTSGAGVVPIPSGSTALLPLAGRALTVAGRAGELVTVVLLKRAVTPFFAQHAPPVIAPVAVAAGILVNGAGRLAGFSLRETSGAAPATVTLTDGGGGTILETIALAAGASLSASGLGPRFTTSLVGAVTGAVTGSARVA